jgi:hypothetical protein
LGGIGFTMSIFITNLAFAGSADEINASKMAILAASLTAGAAGCLWLKLLGRPVGATTTWTRWISRRRRGRRREAIQPSGYISKISRRLIGLTTFSILLFN